MCIPDGNELRVVNVHIVPFNQVAKGCPGGRSNLITSPTYVKLFAGLEAASTPNQPVGKLSYAVTVVPSPAFIKLAPACIG